MTNYTYEEIKAMSRDERYALYKECNRKLKEAQYTGVGFDECYEQYSLVSAVMDDLYREENEPSIREYFAKYFEGKTWEEIRADEDLYERWGFYSDYHKDVFGYRPHDVVCGVYVRPY